MPTLKLGHSRGGALCTVRERKSPRVTFVGWFDYWALENLRAVLVRSTEAKLLDHCETSAAFHPMQPIVCRSVVERMRKVTRNCIGSFESAWIQEAGHFTILSQSHSEIPTLI